VLSLLRSSMTPAHRFARVLVLPQDLCGETDAPCGSPIHRPSLLIRFGDERLPSVSADRAVCDGLTRPPAACLATVRGARARCVRPTSASHYFRLRALAPRSFPASLRGLRLAPSPWACTPDEGDWGTWRFKTPDPLQRAAPGFSRGVSSSARSRCHRASDTPVASPWPSLRSSRSAIPPSQPRPCLHAVREEPLATTIQDAFHRQPAAPCAGRTHSRERSREVSVSTRVPVFLHPPLRTFVRWSCELGARP